MVLFIPYLEMDNLIFVRYELKEPEDQKWGSIESDNVTFNGLIGQVQRLVSWQ